MGQLRKLAGQTAVYGLGTIVPRVLNYLLLTPFYTYLFAQDKYGTFTEIYAYIAFLLVVLTYGMETTYFRFSESEKNNNKVFGTAMTSLIATSVLFLIICVLFRQSLANLIKYPDNPEYIVWLGVIVATDAVSAIPFANLRRQNKAIKFVFIKVINVLINIGLNLFFFVYCPKIVSENPGSWVSSVYSADIGVGYTFISNLIASSISLLIILPDAIKIHFDIDKVLLKKMLRYTFPLLIVGIAGMINEVSDKIFLKYLIVPPEEIVDKNKYVLEQIGIYGANYRIAVLMSIFIQMFRFAAEPFFFAKAKDNDSKQTYAAVMKYFILFGLIIFLGVTLFIDIFQFFIGPEFREGLHIVPVVLLANLFLGISFNLSIWYKLNNKTQYGAYISLIGAFITVLLNVILIPIIGYTGSAWATFICYFFMMYFSYKWGQKHYPINYALKQIAFYFSVALILYFLFALIHSDIMFLNITVSVILFVSFISIIYYFERYKIRSL